MTEQQLYDVVERLEDIELRRYPAHLVAEVRVTGSFEDAGNRAFRLLAGYIGGANRTSDRIAMTAPVVQSPSERVAMTAPVLQSEVGAQEHVVAFVLPSSLTADSVPQPTDPAVSVRVVPERLAAAVSYSGRWSESSYRSHLEQLQRTVAAAGWRPAGQPLFARFDPPFKPWFLRRNEVVVDVERADGEAARTE